MPINNVTVEDDKNNSRIDQRMISLPNSRSTTRLTLLQHYKLCTHIIEKNAVSVPSQLGGGKHGLLGLVLNDELYLTLASTDFIKTTNPGTVEIIPTGSTGPQIDILVRNHKKIT